MKIGYSVEGSTDRALIKGLARRGCPGEEVVEGSFRGTTRMSRRREVGRICLELSVKGAEVIVLLSDSNKEDWRTVMRQEEGRIPTEFKHLVLIGVCARNVECWICADAEWLSKRMEGEPADFQAEDPKSAFEEALGITPRDRKESEIEELVQEAPLRNWLRNRSFEDFYDKAWAKSKELGCGMENVREE